MNERLKISAPIVAVIFTLLAITWAGILSLCQHMKQTEIERSYNLSQNVSGLFAEQVARTIESIENLIDFAAYEIRQHGSANQLKDMADSGALTIKPVVQVTFVDTDGFIVATDAGPDHARTDLRDREHIQIHLNGKVEGLYIGAPVFARVSAKWGIPMSKRLMDRDGKFIGIIVAHLDPFYFEKFLESE